MATLLNTNDCSICFEKLNNSTHKLISCEFGDCTFGACKACIRTYLLNTATDPHCMECKKMWSEQYIVAQLNRSFIINDYKIHRRSLLLDREISKMPETMNAAERYKRIDDQKERSSELTAELNEARKTVDKLYMQLQESHRMIHLLKNGKESDNVERKKFIMPCPNNDCRGYLSTQYKCEMCNLFTCADCFDLIGTRKDDPHTCKEENVQSAELIKKETKPCPTCGTRISKISGCDQMWCPECHKAFSWRTGLVDNGVIHNPHFYQYQRDNAGATAPARNPGDVMCGGICNWYALNNNILKKLLNESELRNKLSDMHRFVTHITQVDLFDTRTRIRNLGDSEELRCKYILQKISKEDLAKSVYQNDVLRKKYTEMLHIYELFSVVGIETFASLIELNTFGAEFIASAIARIDEYNKLRDYCNKQFKTISLTYNHTVPYINKLWAITSKKYTITTIKRKKNNSTEVASEVPTEVPT